MKVLRVACNHETSFDDAARDPACFLNAAEIAMEIGRLQSLSCDNFSRFSILDRVEEARHFLEQGTWILAQREEDRELFTVAESRLSEVIVSLISPRASPPPEHHFFHSQQHKPFSVLSRHYCLKIQQKYSGNRNRSCHSQIPFFSPRKSQKF